MSAIPSDDHISIKSWSEEDRPREKLHIHGREVLSNAELIAILLGSGSKNESAVSLAQRILKSVDHNLLALGKLEIEDLTQFRGIGPAKAITLIAALELGRRRKAENSKTKNLLTSSHEVYEHLAPRLADLNHEELHVIFLNQRNEIIKTEMIFSGGVTATVVDNKVIFKKALQYLSTSIIIAHNHPSGSLEPSIQDKRITEKLIKAGKMLDIKVTDHMIVSDEGYFSFADEGLMG